MEQSRNRKLNPYRWNIDKVRYHIDTPPPPTRNVMGIGDVLKDVMEGFNAPVQDSILVLRKAWPKLVGPQIATHSEPGYIKDFALHVFVDHPGWMPELERLKRPLQRKLQASYREMKIRRIHFSLQHK